MTVSELRTLVDNLDEYIHIPGGIDRLKKMVLHLAVSGQLVPQDSSEGTGEELFQRIQAEKQELIKRDKLKKQKLLPEIDHSELSFSIPSSWKWALLGDIIQLQSGADLVPSQYNDNSYGVPYITGASNIDNGSILINRWTNSPKNIALKGDLLITCKGTIGTMAFLKDEKVHIARQIMAVRFNTLLESEYIKHVISTNVEKLKDSAQSIIPGIARDDMLTMPVPLPPLAEQKHIVEKVDSIFDLIDQLAEVYESEQNERSKLVASSLAQLAKGEDDLEGGLALTHLSEIIRTKADAKILRQTILHLAVSGQLVPQDPSEGSGEELYRKIQSEKANLVKKGTLKKQKLLKNITESETPFTIPSSWKWARLADIGQVVGGGTPSSSNVSYYTSEIDGGIPWLTPADLRGYKDMYITRGARNITKAGLQNSSARLLPKNTILFSSRAPIGHLAIAANELATNQGFKSVVPYSEMIPEYIYRWLQFYAPVIDANASGTTFREVSGAIVERQLIPLPPFDEQKRIVTKTTQLLNLITELEEHLVD